MTQVKFNNEKWLVLIDGVWREIAQKDWEKVKNLCRIATFHAPFGAHDDNILKPEKWLPTPDQIYSLPNEVEFKIKGYVLNERNNWILCDEVGNWYEKYKSKGATVKQVAHLKDSEKKKEWTCEGGYKFCQKDDQGNCSCKVERSEEVKKEIKSYTIKTEEAMGFHRTLQNKIRNLIDKYWRFDNHQQPLSSWHDKQDLLEEIYKISISKDSQSDIESLREEITNRNEYYEDKLDAAQRSIDGWYNDLQEALKQIKELESKLAERDEDVDKLSRGLLANVKKHISDDKLSPKEEEQTKE